MVDDSVRLIDMADLQGLDRDEAEKLSNIHIAQAPPAGGSRIIALDAVRAALSKSGANLATLTLNGATRCTVRRPTTGARQADSGRESAKTRLPDAGSGEAGATGRQVESDARTLRQAVKQHLTDELGRYGGSIDVVFDRASDQVLDLTSPPFGFQIRRRGGSPLGLTPLEIDVTNDGRIVQTVPLVTQVTLRREFVSAAKAINQGATVQTSDLTVSEVIVDRLDAPWTDDPATVVGQRAKRFIPQGTLLTADQFEPVPLVRRGELVTLECVSGAVTIVTSGRAEADGLLGESVPVRAADARRVQYDAVVTGPGVVRIGESAGSSTRLASTERNAP
ncbi:MAG: flagellar basal body P-ring formation protein FlgA [Phycisphaerae bacterium]|nr:flagellar basal body P-ring formation protein FlgA [Phycisphaerae bacterium]